jgi:hypothetical protein
MLYLAALFSAGVIASLLVTLFRGTQLSAPWVFPAIVFICQVISLFAGRRHILPHALADSAARSAILLTPVVGLTMMCAYAGVWLVLSLVGTARMVPLVGLVLWFLLLWLVVRQQQNWYSAAKTGSR